MGYWRITIDGCGPHHNKLNPQDANRIAAECVKKLREAGQSVSAATFSVLGQTDFIDVGYLDTQDEIEKAALASQQSTPAPLPTEVPAAPVAEQPADAPPTSEK